MNKHPEPLFQKRNFSPPGMKNFANIFLTPPKTFQFDLGVAWKEILTLSALYRSCQFLPLSDRTNFCIELPSFKAWKELRILVISETFAASGFVFRVGNVSWPIPNSFSADFCVAVVFAKAACVSP